MNALLAQISLSQKDYPYAVAHFSKAPAVLTARPLVAVNYAEALLETHSVDAATMLCSEPTGG